MSSSFKSNLTVGGPGLDKSKLQLRRPTPDSDVLASSDDDREHVRPPIRQAYSGGRRLSSSGWMHDIQSTRKNSLPSTSFPEPALYDSRPATSAFSWSTSSFASTASGSRLKEVLPSPTSVFSSGDRPLPSPTSELDTGIGFLLNQQHQLPLRKAVRSQSYSIGQGDIENSPVGKFSMHLRGGVRHKPSKPSMLGDSSLAQLREDDADEVESNSSELQHGVRLPAGYWEREHQQALLKQAAVEHAMSRNRATSTDSPHVHPHRKATAGMRNASYGAAADYAIDELDDPEANMNHPSMSLTRRFSEQVSFLAREHETEVEIIDSPKKPQWATNNIPMPGSDALGRRHSFAHYGVNAQNYTQPTLSNTKEEDEDIVSPRESSKSKSPEQADLFDASAYFAGYGPASRAINASAISAAHPDPVVPNTSLAAGNPYAVPPSFGRQGRRLFVVTFKCSRADIYYLFDNTGLEIRRGDLVIVDGDRGYDLGQVTHADVSMEEARKQKAAANEEHFRWLVMFSQYSLAGTTNDTGMLGCLARAQGRPNAMATPGTNNVGTPDHDTKPKMIKRLAQQHEIMGLRDKEGSEAKAKRLGAQKAADHKLPMEVLDAEYQADYHKLIYYYYAETYVNFNELVCDLFKQYKVRIWMSAVNPASVPNPAMHHQPPSAIGPGAVLHSNAGRSHAVGPGFGNNNHRGNAQYGRGRQQAPQGNYQDGYNAFSYQLPDYNPQANYGMPWAAHGQQQMYAQPGMQPGMQSGQYPNATASGSPMNYNGYYPPTTYGASPAYGASSSNYRGGYSSTTAPGSSQSNTATAGPSYTTGQYASQSYNSAPNAGPSGSYGSAPNAGPSGSYGNAPNAGTSGSSYTATSGANYNPAFDPALMTGMQNMGFGK